MSDGDQPEPLWATSLADQPRRELDFGPPRREEPEAPRAGSEAQGLRAAALGVLAGLLVVALAAALARPTALVVKTVPSYWDEVKMTCDTVRLEQGERALELFHCRATGGGTLPPGLYRSPGSQWTSDLTRRDARVSEIEITPGGELTGWAAY